MKVLVRFLAIVILATSPFSAGAADGAVSRAQFTTAILDREPVDEITSIDNSTARIFFFTELRNLDEQTVTHRWIYDGKVVAEVPFTIRGPRWRVYSSKILPPDWTGDWKVDVVAEDGAILASRELKHTGN